MTIGATAPISGCASTPKETEIANTATPNGSPRRIPALRRSAGGASRSSDSESTQDQTRDSGSLFRWLPARDPADEGDLHLVRRQSAVLPEEVLLEAAGLEPVGCLAGCRQDNQIRQPRRQRVGDARSEQPFAEQLLNLPYLRDGREQLGQTRLDLVQPLGPYVQEEDPAGASGLPSAPTSKCCASSGQTTFTYVVRSGVIPSIPWSAVSRTSVPSGQGAAAIAERLSSIRTATSGASGPTMCISASASP